MLPAQVLARHPCPSERFASAERHLALRDANLCGPNGVDNTTQRLEDSPGLVVSSKEIIQRHATPRNSTPGTIRLATKPQRRLFVIPCRGLLGGILTDRPFGLFTRTGSSQARRLSASSTTILSISSSVKCFIYLLEICCDPILRPSARSGKQQGGGRDHSESGRCVDSQAHLATASRAVSSVRVTIRPRVIWRQKAVYSCSSRSKSGPM